MPCNCYWEKRAPNEDPNKRAICATYCAASINLHKRVRDFVGLTPGGTETMWARTRVCSEGSEKAVRGARQEESAEDCQGETLLETHSIAFQTGLGPVALTEKHGSLSHSRTISPGK